jgi:hypothetical protein
MEQQHSRDFPAWLVSYAGIHGPLGELARAVLDDPQWPEGPADLERYRDRLASRGVTPDIVDTLEEAWGRYRRGR